MPIKVNHTELPRHFIDKASTRGSERGETSGTKEAPEKENEAKVPEHFKELVEGTRELCKPPAQTKEAGDEPVKKKQERIQTILGTEEGSQVIAIGAGWRGKLLEQAKRRVKRCARVDIPRS
jgi:hypothetical protein